MLVVHSAFCYLSIFYPYKNSSSMKSEYDFLKCNSHFILCVSWRSRPEVFYKKCVLKNFAKFTGKDLCQSLIFGRVHPKEFWFIVFTLTMIILVSFLLKVAYSVTVQQTDCHILTYSTVLLVPKINVYIKV